MVNIDDLIKEFQNNVNNLKNNKSLINNNIWLGNPHPKHDYFVLITAYNDPFEQDFITHYLSKIPVTGVTVEKVKDTGWNSDTIRVRL